MSGEDGVMSTPETKACLAERLKAITVSLQMEPAQDAADANATAKFIFDLRAAAECLDGLDGLLTLIEEADGVDLLHDSALVKRAKEIRELLTRSNPEPRIV